MERLLCGEYLPNQFCVSSCLITSLLSFCHLRLITPVVEQYQFLAAVRKIFSLVLITQSGRSWVNSPHPFLLVHHSVCCLNVTVKHNHTATNVWTIVWFCRFLNHYRPWQDTYYVIIKPMPRTMPPPPSFFLLTVWSDRVSGMRPNILEWTLE